MHEYIGANRPARARAATKHRRPAAPRQSARNIATMPQRTVVSKPSFSATCQPNFAKFHQQKRFMALEVDCPPLGDSVLEGDVSEWKKNIGDWVNEDDVLVVLETAKVGVDIPAPQSGILKAQFLKIGDVAKVGDKLCEIDTDAPKPAAAAAPAAPAAASKPAAAPPAAATPAAASKPAAAPPAAASKPAAPKQAEAVTTDTAISGKFVHILFNNLC